MGNNMTTNKVTSAVWTKDCWCPCQGGGRDQPTNPDHVHSIKICKSIIPLAMMGGEPLYWTGHSLAAFFTLGATEFVNGGLIGRPIHAMVVVIYECAFCGKLTRVTYDLVVTGKRQRCGEYDQFRTDLAVSFTKRSYSWILQKFEETADHYSLTKHNCGHWAGRFYEVIA